MMISKEKKNLENLLKGWLFYLPLILCVLLMLPRLLSPQFGLFDDGKTMIAAKEMAKNLSYFTFEADEGRFRPIYWLYFSSLNWIFGDNPFWFFLGNTTLLILATWLLMVFTQMVTGRRVQAWIAGLFFVLSGPVIENYYTLSKGEPLQVVLLLLSMLSSAWIVQTPNLWKRGMYAILGVLASVCALAVKETTIVMIPISLAWLVLAWIRSRKPVVKEIPLVWGKLASGVLVVISSVSAGIFLVLRRLMIDAVLTEGHYTNDYAIRVETILASLVRWFGWLLRDFLFLLPLVLLVILWLIVRKKSADGGFVLESIIWMGGWAAIYLPWYFMAEYYMLPFTVGVAIFLGAVSEIARESLSMAQSRMRWMTVLCLGTSILLFGVTLFNNASNAGIQLAVDAANAKMLKNLVKIAPPGSSVMINIQYPNEYTNQIPMYVNTILGRPDLKVDYFRSQSPLGTASGSTGHNLIITPVVKNQPILTVRMGVVEPTQEIWLSLLDNYLILDEWQMISSSQYRFPLLVVDFSRIFCPFLKGRNFCERSAPLLDTREFSYGWKFYELDLP
jgi:hypothetical protein